MREAGAAWGCVAGVLGSGGWLGHVTLSSGFRAGPQARTILMQSSLPQAQLASIW